jgi:hypothetical protein
VSVAASVAVVEVGLDIAMSRASLLFSLSAFQLRGKSCAKGYCYPSIAPSVESAYAHFGLLIRFL